MFSLPMVANLDFKKKRCESLDRNGQNRYTITLVSFQDSGSAGSIYSLKH
jgi:hypothetical protein